MIYDLSKMSEIDVHSLSLSCIRSYLYYHESKYYKFFTDSILTHTDGKWSKGVKWFVSNTARAMKSGSNGFNISLDNHTYVDNKLGIGFRGVKALLEFLEENSYIDIYKGFVVEWKVVDGKRVPERTVPSCLVFKKRIYDLCGTKNIPNLWGAIEHEGCVEIKNRKTQEIMSGKGKVGIKEVS